MRRSREAGGREHRENQGVRWPIVLVVYGLTAFVEALGVSQVFAFMPLELRHVGLPEADIPRWVGLFGAVIFLVGLPLVSLWGVWADRYSRKAVIIRSALVEAVVFGGVAASATPWQLAISLLLVGFQLGNTGVMLATLRDVVPRERLGTIIAVFGITGPIGFAAGPALGGYLVDGLGAPLATMYAISAALSLGTALLIAVGIREVRPAVVPQGRILDLAYGAIRGIFTDPTTVRLFAIFGASFLARQMTAPYLPLLVERTNGGLAGLAGAIGLVVGTAGLVGAAASPVVGAVGDRVGFRRVLGFALAGGGAALVLMTFAPSIATLALAAATSAAFAAATSAMIFSLLATQVPAERRSATLNLVYLPLYLGGIAGPAIGSAVVSASLSAVFIMGGVMLVAVAGVVLRRR